MRTWRVGTISMGASLVLLGVFLLLKQMFNWEMASIIAGWWPLLMIVLGIEMLLYLYFSNNDKPYLKYDILSIVFVSIIGFVGIGFTMLNGFGVSDKLDQWLGAEEKTMDLPSFSKPIADDVKRVVVNTGPHPLTIEGGSSGEKVSVFGIYRSQVVGDERVLDIAEDYILEEQQGDTLFVTLKGLPERNHPFGSFTEMNATMVVPTDIQLEVTGNYQSLTLKPRRLENDWSVSTASDVFVQLSDQADVILSAENVDHIEGEGERWTWIEEKETDTGSNSENDVASAHEYVREPTGFLQVGEGTHQLSISNVNQLSVSVAN